MIFICGCNINLQTNHWNLSNLKNYTVTSLLTNRITVCLTKLLLVRLHWNQIGFLYWILTNGQLILCAMTSGKVKCNGWLTDWVINHMHSITISIFADFFHVVMTFTALS